MKPFTSIIKDMNSSTEQHLFNLTNYNCKNRINNDRAARSREYAYYQLINKLIKITTSNNTEKKKEKLKKKR